MSAVLLVTWKHGYYPWQKDMPGRMQLVENVLKDGAAVGMADWSGYVGYYSSRRIINIDGAVNNAAFDAIRRGNLLSYMKQVGIRYVFPNRYLLNEHFLGVSDEVKLRPITDGFFEIVPVDI
jgi:hypothetical protein